jgi:hypothetical protein
LAYLPVNWHGIKPHEDDLCPRRRAVARNHQKCKLLTGVRSAVAVMWLVSTEYSFVSTDVLF